MNVMFQVVFGLLLLTTGSFAQIPTCTTIVCSTGSFCSANEVCTCIWPKVNSSTSTATMLTCIDPPSTVASIAIATQPYQLDPDTASNVKTTKWIFIIVYLVWLSAILIAFAGVCMFVAPDRIIHLNEEITLIATFVLVMVFSEDRTNPFCQANAALLHYLFLCSLTFFCLEALHTYSLVTYIVPKNGFFPILANIAIGYGVPLIVMGFSIGFLWNTYGLTKHCWCDLSTDESWAFLFPIGLLTFVCLVIAEAQRLGSYKQLPDSDKKQLKSAKYSEGSLLFVVPATVATYIFGLVAVDLQRLPYWIIFFILITIDGPLIFYAHCMAHPKLRRLLGKCFPCCRDKNQPIEEYEKVEKPPKSRVAPTTSNKLKKDGWTELKPTNSQSKKQSASKGHTNEPPANQPPPRKNQPNTNSIDNRSNQLANVHKPSRQELNTPAKPNVGPTGQNFNNPQERQLTNQSMNQSINNAKPRSPPKFVADFNQGNSQRF